MKGAAFAMLPYRAIGDSRLTSLDLRTLAAISWHDRGSRPRGKGAGCWAGNKKLTEEVGCDYTNLSSTVTKLGTLGYITREPHPVNRKLRVYRVVYDALPIDKQSSPANGLPDHKLSPTHETVSESIASASEDVLGPEWDRETGEIVCRPNPQGNEEQEQSRSIYIPLKREDISRSELTNSPKGRAWREVARNGNGASVSVGTQLAMIERRIKEATWEPGIAESFIEEINNLAMQVPYSDPNYGWMERLLNTCEAVADGD